MPANGFTDAGRTGLVRPGVGRHEKKTQHVGLPNRCPSTRMNLPYSTFQEKKPGGFRDKSSLMPDKAAIIGLARLRQE